MCNYCNIVITVIHPQKAHNKGANTHYSLYVTFVIIVILLQILQILQILQHYKYYNFLLRGMGMEDEHIPTGMLYLINTSVGKRWGTIFYQDGERVGLFCGNSNNTDIPKGQGLYVIRTVKEVKRASQREYSDIKEFRAVHREFLKKKGGK